MQTKIQFLTLLLLISFVFQPVYSQSPLDFGKTDLKKENLKGSVFRVVEHTYDAANKFGEDVKQGLKETDTTYFNDFGNYWKIISYESKVYYGWNMSNSTNYQYNSQKQLIRKESAVKKEYSEFQYFPDGKLKEENTYDDSGNLTSKVKWQYSGGNAGWSKYSGNGDLVSTCVITNGGKKMVVDGGFAGMENEYDVSGRLVSSVVYLGGNNGATSEETYYRYNSMGDLIASESNMDAMVDWSYESHDRGIRYIYEYDKYGNWILRKSYENGRIVTWTEREITYASSSAEIMDLMRHEERRIFLKDSLDRRNRFVRDSIAKRQQFIKDSIATRQQFVRDSIAERRQFILDSLDRRNKFVIDSLDQVAKVKKLEKQQFVAWLSNTCNSYVNYNSDRDPLLYAMTGITKEQSWSLRRKDGNIKTMIRKGNTFDFTMKDRTVVSGIVFKNKIQIPFGPGEDDRITALFTEDKKYVLIFFEELDRDSMVRYYCNLACLATQSGENTDTKVYAFPSKCRNEIMGYYHITVK